MKQTLLAEILKRLHQGEFQPGDEMTCEYGVEFSVKDDQGLRIKAGDELIDLKLLRNPVLTKKPGDHR
jgi:hypothetical protein